MMKKEYLIDYIGCAAVRIVGSLIRALPLAAALWLGRRGGDIAFSLNTKRRSIGYANLKAALGAEFAPRERLNIIKQEYQNLGESLVEVLRIPLIDERYTERYIEWKNTARIDEALSKGDGAILLTAHFGNWELSSVAAAIRGYPLIVLAREQKYRRLYGLLNRYRGMKGCKVISKGIQTREILKGLKDNEIIGMLVDQDGGKNGTFVNFFGRPASTPRGVFAFASRNESAVLPGFIIRKENGRHEIVIEDDVMKQDERKTLQGFADILAGYVKENPSQWLWMHKRWKSTPVRYVLILDDGKAGHLAQSMAALKQIEHILAERYQKLKEYNPEGAALADEAFPLLRYRIAKVSYKNRFSRFGAELCASIANRRCQGCMRCLRLVLPEETYDELMSTYADIVISCGASSLALNILMKLENNARSIVIMKPNLFGLRRFDLAIVGRHDRPRNKKNVLILDAALNLIDKTKLEEEAKKFSDDAGLELGNELVFGLFIGGDAKGFSMSPQMIKRVASGIKRVSEGRDADILVTTSRRTNVVIEAALKEEFKNYPRCKLLLVANEKNLPNAVAGMFGLSSVLIVSGDSVSMVSEAAQSGRYVIVFRPAARIEDKKMEFLSRLEKDGYIKIVGPDEIADTITYFLEKRPPIKPLADNERLRSALEKII